MKGFKLYIPAFALLFSVSNVFAVETTTPADQTPAMDIISPSNTTTSVDISNPTDMPNSSSTSNSSSAMSNKEKVRIWYEEVIIKKNLSVLDNLLAKDVVLELAPSYKSPVSNSNKLVGIDQVKQHIARLNKSGEFSGPIIYLIAEGNKVALYRVVTQKRADGRTTVVPWASFYEFDNNGKIISIKHVHDTLGEMQQLNQNKNAVNENVATSR